MVEQMAEKQPPETAEKQPSDGNQHVVFSETKEVIPLGFTNKLLRKIAFAGGVSSFLLTARSGMKFNNPWRTASGLGSAGITLASLLMPEKANALPDAPIPSQMGHALLHPMENTLFTNRSATWITDALKLMAGIQGGRKQEMWEGSLKIGMKSIDIAGMSDQDRREKHAIEAAQNGKDFKEHVSPLRKIFANRWVSLGGSALAATFQYQQAAAHHDKNMRISAINYFINVACLAADNAITEHNIKKQNHAKGR